MSAVSIVDSVIAAGWALAAHCRCGGHGETRERFEIFLLTDDPRFIDSPAALVARRRVEVHGSRVERSPRAAAVIVKPCRVCQPFRKAVANLVQA